MKTVRGGERERGFALVAVMGVMVLMLGIGAAIHAAVMAETSLRGAHARATSGFYAAEAGINRGMGDYRNIFLSYSVPSGADFDPHSFNIGPRLVHYKLDPVPDNPFTVTVPAGRAFAGLSAQEYRYTVTSQSELTAGDTEVSIGSQFNVDNIPLFQFLAFYQDDLEILPGPTMNLTGPVHTNGDLYLNCNSSCAGSPCVGGLTISDDPPTVTTVSVTASGDIIRGRKDVSSCSGTVQISKLTDVNHDGALDLGQMPCGGVQTSASLAPWLGAVKAHEPGVQVPQPSVLSRGVGQYWMKADLRITLRLDTPDAVGLFPIVVEDVGGNVDGTLTPRLQTFMVAEPGRIFYNDVPKDASHQNPTTDCVNPSAGAFCHRDSYQPDFEAPYGNQAAVYACPGGDLLAPTVGFTGCTTIQNVNLSTGGVTARRGGFYNNREHAWTYVLNVNAHDLLAWNRAQAPSDQLFDPDDVTDGGIVLFLSVVGPGSTGPIPSPRYAVRIFGSSDLDFPAGVADPTGLTAVSDQAFIVEGDYNVGTVAHPKQPAAVMGDTVNVLSSNWSGGTLAADGSAWLGYGGCRNDCQSFQILTRRPAKPTTINSAFLAGVDRTTPGNYNGGFENYPRFHESWAGGMPLDYRGSFVSLGEPQRNNGAWCGTGNGCNIYNPPIRNWNYDTDFQNVLNLPPLTPLVVSVQQILFTENFR
jgi:hypothetical protein